MRKGRIELAEGFFMAVIGFILGNEKDVWRGDFREMLDGRGKGMGGDGEHRMENFGRTGEPRIDEDCESALFGRVSNRRMRLIGREG